jgi:2,3-dihydro-2,3-dihydroxybenzoate dehydrogenase
MVGLRIDLANKVAIVTGAQAGIGRAIALTLAEAGAKVVVVDLDARELEKVVEKILKNGGESFSYVADVSIKRYVQEMVDTVWKRFSRMDILVNNAGVLRVGPFLETREEDWDATFAVNLKGVFLCSQAVAKRMVEQKNGRIINISSIAGKVPRINNVSYCASKAGVILLTKVMALELARFGITVNAICPGSTATEMVLQVVTKGDPKVLEGIVQGDLDTYRSGIPMGRLARPEEQAAMALYLASDYANHITGQTFTVDGGQIML